MYRALAVISASAWLALAPAALAATHKSSHKSSHAKHGAAETSATMKAKLRHAAEADEPPSLVRTASHVKAGAKHHRGQPLEAPDEAAPSHASKHRGKAVAEDEAAPSRSHGRSKSKHHAADEDAADATETKVSSKRHGRHAAAEAAESGSKSHARSKSKHRAADDEETADAAATKSSSRRRGHADVEEAEAEAPKSRSKHHAAEADSEAAPVERVSLKSTKACVAAHVRAHGRPKGARARAALQRECVKEVEAARRKAQEEAMIRNWSAPRGPLIYPGALPHGAAPSAVSEPPATAEATAPSTIAPPDPALASAGPAKGEATVQQQPAPSAQSSFLGSLWSRVRRGPQRAPGSPAPTVAGLVGSDEARLKAELGEPELMRAEGDGALWTYKLPGCALYVFLGREETGGPWKVKGAQSGPLKRGGAAPDADLCLKGGRS